MLCGTHAGVDSARSLPVRLNLWAPKYWPTWIGLGLLRALDPLPVPLQMRLGVGLGKIIRRLPISWIRIARRNIELCLPALSAAERADLLDRKSTRLNSSHLVISYAV